MAKIDDLLEKLVAKGGSDLHISTGAPAVVRVHGSMETLTLDPLSAEQSAALLGEITPPDLLAEFEETHDCDFAYALTGLGRFRVNLFANRLGMGAVFRQIPTVIPSFAQLQLPEVLASFTELAKGLVLVTGPTGSGKSTTLAAMIDRINTERHVHLITIEDPIEFVHPNKASLVNQREVGTHTASFATALRAALREDPDVILVGEMRDLETTMMGLEAAETGHLVFATLHTCSAASTVDRIVDQFPEGAQTQVRTMLASCLRGVVSQCLLKRKDGAGRVAALEILVCTPAVAANIRDGKTHQIPSALQTGGRHGMVALNDALVKLVSRGLVKPSEARSKAIDKEGLSKAFQVAGVQSGAVAPKATKPALSRTR